MAHELNIVSLDEQRPAPRGRKTKEEQEKLERDDFERFQAQSSKFERSLRKIRKQIKKGGVDEKVILMTYTSLFKTVASLVPIAEKNYRRWRTDRSMFALNSIVNNVREIAVDIRNVRNLEEQVEHLNHAILEPIFTLITQNLINENYEARRALNEVITKPTQRKLVKKTLDNLMRSQGKYLSESLKAVQQQITDYLIEK